MEKPLIVIDTNVYVSATTIYQNSPSRQVLEALRNNQIKVVISEPLLKELANTLAKPRVRKFTRFSPEQEKFYVESVREMTQVISGDNKINVSPDPDDNHLFSCAIEAGADYIISGDKRHVLSIPEFRGVQTILPRDFVETVLSKEYEKAA